ncbi:MAG: hypothetical protein IPM53_11610 [Anaerolineaceae bacterium]|nr:hypothetical protein [Anaerolineaceae bacterium]
MKRLKLWTLLMLLAILGSAGCTVATENNPEATAPPAATAVLDTAVPPRPTQDNSSIRQTPLTTPAVEAVPTTDATPVVGEVPAGIMTAVLDNLTDTTPVAREAITVVQAEAVVWSDGSLGCPQPGEVYTQATVEGYRIVLEANGRTYDYHAAETGHIVLCENALPQPPAVGTPSS